MSSPAPPPSVQLSFHDANLGEGIHRDGFHALQRFQNALDEPDFGVAANVANAEPAATSGPRTRHGVASVATPQST